MILPQGLRLIYTGESSVLTGHRAATKPSQAEIHGMREVTPEAVAYTACQVSSRYKVAHICWTLLMFIKIYINLSSLENWAAEDGYFSIEDLFDICMSYFTAEPIDEEWTHDTLKYLTRYVSPQAAWLLMFSCLANCPRSDVKRNGNAVF